MSNETSIWGPVPPWVDLSEDQDAYIVGSVATTLILAILAVTLRLACRLSRAGPGLGIDDYAILVALVSLHLLIPRYLPRYPCNPAPSPLFQS